MMKGYKVTDKKRTKLVGIACSSLDQLIVKGKEKLGIDEKAFAVLDDGTIVGDEEYFQTLPPQTVFILYREKEEITTGVDIILNVLRQINFSYLETGEKANEFLISKTNELLQILEDSDDKEKMRTVWKSTPKEDPDWFADLETNAQTKEEYMFKKSQHRIQGYLYKFQEDVRRNKYILENIHFRKISDACLKFFKRRLKSDEYFGYYFDRRYSIKNSDLVNLSEKKSQLEISESPSKKLKIEWCQNEKEKEFMVAYDKVSFCDASGTFFCQGKWKSNSCELLGQHHINPYLSKEARILFSTWNLDHRNLNRLIENNFKWKDSKKYYWNGYIEDEIAFKISF